MVNYFPETLLKSHPEVVFETNYIDPAVQGELPAPAYYCYYPAPPPPHLLTFKVRSWGHRALTGGKFFAGMNRPGHRQQTVPLHLGESAQPVHSSKTVLSIEHRFEAWGGRNRSRWTF